VTAAAKIREAVVAAMDEGLTVREIEKAVKAAAEAENERRRDAAARTLYGGQA
jgi:pectin methylesterase-like acyl-CoA thioesterase